MQITRLILFSYLFSTHICAESQIMSDTLGSDDGSLQSATALLLGTIRSHT